MSRPRPSLNLAWLVGRSDDCEDCESVEDLLDYDSLPELDLVYAPTARIARVVAWPHWAASPLRPRGLHPVAFRYPAADHLAALEGRPGVEMRCRAFRELGWRFADEDECESCDLYAFGLPDYEVTEDDAGNRLCLACRLANGEPVIWSAGALHLDPDAPGGIGGAA